MKHSAEYDEYIQSPEWRQKSRDCQLLTRSRCILFPWKNSYCSHHLTYRNLKQELVIRDIVPLSAEAHTFIHFGWGGILWNDRHYREIINWVLRLLFLGWLGGGIGWAILIALFIRVVI